MANQDQIILMADIIDSRSADQGTLMISFKEIIQYINKTNARHLLSPLTITLGDEFQAIATSLPSAIQIIFNLEELLINRNSDYKLRYVLVEGKIETPINKEIAYGMLGSGLTSARELLNTSKSNKNRFIFQLNNVEKSNALNNALLVCQGIIDDWRLKKDYNLVSEFLNLGDYKKVAEELDKTRSQIWKREKSLRIDQYLALKEVIRYIGEQK